MSTEAHIYAGQWGHTHTITVQDEDGVVVDLSTTATKVIVFKDPSGNEEEKTAAFVTDGSDGKLQYEVTDEDTVDDEAGNWLRWAKVTFADGEYVSTPERYRVWTPGTQSRS